MLFAACYHATINLNWIVIMKLNFKNIAAGAIFALASVTANAALIDNDTYTTDALSGLDWLDVTASMGRSYNDVSSEFGSGGDFEGWRYATGLEFNDLVRNTAGDTVTSSGRSYLSETGHVGAADVLTELLGSTLDAGRALDGLGTWDSAHGYAEGAGWDFTMGILSYNFDAERMYVAIIDDNDEAGQLDYSFAQHSQMLRHVSNFDVGSYLVRDVSTVPEPATLILLGLGIAGLGLARKQKKS